ILAVDGDATGSRIVEARDQVEDRRLAGARGADQGDGAAGRRLQADVVQRRLGAAVGERYRFKAHGAAGDAERTGARRIDDLRLLVAQRSEEHTSELQSL